MDIGKKLVLFLLVSVCSVGCFPSRPLNDRPSSELAWQAWLLVDSQNQQHNDSDRRITPKSVFIAPKLGQRNDSLPDCAEGYRADSMGRCVKFVKVDEAAHFDFLLSQLNEMYAAQSSEEDQDEVELAPTAGPLQVNIPFGQPDEIDTNPDVAMIAAPTNGQFDDKVNVKRHPSPPHPDTVKNDDVEMEKERDDQTMKKKHSGGQVESPPLSQEYDYEEEIEESETATQTEQPTITEESTEATTIIPTTEDDSTEEATTEIPTTPPNKENDDDLKALFFLMPKNKTSTAKPINNMTEKPIKTVENGDEAASMLQEELLTDPEHTVEEVASLLEPERNGQQHSSYVRFPNDKLIRYPGNTESFQDHRSEVPPVNVGEYFSNNQERLRPQSLELSVRQIQDLFRQYVHQPSSYVDRTHTPHDHIFNHRNRDRNQDLWKLTAPVRNDGAQKPLVLQFGRYPSDYLPQNTYNPKHLPSHHDVEYYGASQDYSNTFGRKRRRGNLR